jgi:hypothetical protein
VHKEDKERKQLMKKYIKGRKKRMKEDITM